MHACPREQHNPETPAVGQRLTHSFFQTWWLVKMYMQKYKNYMEISSSKRFKVQTKSEGQKENKVRRQPILNQKSHSPFPSGSPWSASDTGNPPCLGWEHGKHRQDLKTDGKVIDSPLFVTSLSCKARQAEI